MLGRVNLGESIRRARERRGWTQNQLAEQLGVAVMTIRNWEADRHSPKNSLARIEEVLGTPLRDQVDDQTQSVSKASDAQLVGELLTRLADRNDTIATLQRQLADHQASTNRTPAAAELGDQWAARRRLRPAPDPTPDPHPDPTTTDT